MISDDWQKRLEALVILPSKAPVREGWHYKQGRSQVRVDRGARTQVSLVEIVDGPIPITGRRVW